MWIPLMAERGSPVHTASLWESCGDLLTSFSLPSQGSIWRKPVEIVHRARIRWITPVIQTPSLLAYPVGLANQVQNMFPCLQLGDEMGFEWNGESET